MMNAKEANAMMNKAQEQREAELHEQAVNYVESRWAPMIEQAAKNGKDSVLVDLPVNIERNRLLQYLKEHGYTAEITGNGKNIVLIMWC